MTKFKVIMFILLALFAFIGLTVFYAVLKVFFIPLLVTFTLGFFTGLAVKSKK